MEESILVQLNNVRQLFAEAAPTDVQTCANYGWIIVKALNAEAETLGSDLCRQLLADYIKLPLKRPSRLHSAILSAAVKVAHFYPEFRFVPFLRLWDLQNLRPEDNEPVLGQLPADGVSERVSHPSLISRVAKAYSHARLLRPSEDLDALQLGCLHPALVQKGYLPSQPMLVSRLKEATTKDGRKLRFATLSTADSREVECVASLLQPHPLFPLLEGKRHYANVGQIYDVQLRQKPDSSEPSVIEAYLSQSKAVDVFPSVIGYIESIDAQHGHMHIYDGFSRHFVASVQRFSRETAGQFVRFVPVVPVSSRFKSAIILGVVPIPEPSSEGIVRTIHITATNTQKGYASWQLTEPSVPIVEALSPLQVSNGETSPSFIQGYLTLAAPPAHISARNIAPLMPDTEHNVIIYLRRSKDGQKRPHIILLS